MAYVANPHDICVLQAAVIQQQAEHIARLEQMLNTQHRQTRTTVQQSTQTDYMPNPSTEQFVQTDAEQTNTDQDRQMPPKVKTVRKSTQTTAKSTNSVVITGSRKRIALEDAKGVSLRKRRAEERTAFAKVATLFGGQDKSGISSVGVQVRYDDGTKNKFVAWGKGAGTDINELDTDTANTTDTGKTDTQNTTEDDTDSTHAEQNTTEQSTAETTDTATEDEEQQALQHTLGIVNLRNKFTISYRILHEFRMAGMPIPPRNVLQEQSVRLAGCVDIYQPSADCSRRSLGDLLEYILGQKKYSYLFDKDGTVNLQLRFSADGAKMSKMKNSVRGVFKIIPPRPSNRESAVSMLPEDEHTLFLYMGNEDRNELEKNGATTFQEMERVAKEGLLVQDRNVRVQWILCADWKAMAILKGVNAPNANHFCLWCKCTKEQIRDFSVPSWDISRSNEEQKRLLESTETTNQKGYIRPDLLPFISYRNIIPDELHLRMRITNKLLNQVVRWSIETKRSLQLLSEMRRIHVEFKLFEEMGDNNSGKIRKWTQPSGDALNKILHNLDLVCVLGDGKLQKQKQKQSSVTALTVAELKAELEARNTPTRGLKKKEDLQKRLHEVLRDGEQVMHTRGARAVTSYEFTDDAEMLLMGCDGCPEEEEVDIRELQEVWAGFSKLMEAIRSVPGTNSSMSPAQFQTAAREWAVRFRQATYNEDVIPYIHCLVYHVPQALEKFSFLPDIGCSQVERKNYDQRCAYFSATSRDGGKERTSVTRQILERENISLAFSDDADTIAYHPSGRRCRRKPKQFNLTSC